jgi:RNA polymerase-binding transcription factor DksA
VADAADTSEGFMARRAKTTGAAAGASGAEKEKGASAALDLGEFGERLQAMKRQLETDLDSQRQDSVEQDGGLGEPGPGQHWEHAGYGDHLADDATELFEREKALTLEGTLRDHLRQVDVALQRVADGTYGRCAVCGRAIGKERLDAIPETTLCLEHKEEAERERGVAAGVPAPNAWNVET